MESVFPALQRSPAPGESHQDTFPGGELLTVSNSTGPVTRLFRDIPTRSHLSPPATPSPAGRYRDVSQLDLTEDSPGILATPSPLPQQGPTYHGHSPQPPATPTSSELSSPSPAPDSPDPIDLLSGDPFAAAAGFISAVDDTLPDTPSGSTLPS